MSEEITKPNYWKSLGELARNEEYEKFLHREFPENGSELTDEVSRRSFLKVMGASIALAGFAACRRPVQKILPYTKMPEEVLPGNPLEYASAFPFMDALEGITIENHVGRPVKIEGNDLHPGSKGKTNIFGQASILGLYDPDRSQFVRKDGKRSTLNAFKKFSAKYFSDTNRNIAFVSEANSSPTYNRLQDQVEEKFPNAKWITYEPFSEANALEGTEIAFGQRLRTINWFDRAKIIVSFDDDFLNPAATKNSVQNTMQYADGRRVMSTDETMSRFYSIESTFTLTGSNADNRLRMKTSEIRSFLYALAAELSNSVSGLSAFNSYSSKFSDHEWVPVLAEELLENRGESILTVGRMHSPELHATVSAINKALGNAGNTVTYNEVSHLNDRNQQLTFAELTQELNNGNIDAVVLVGTNPAFTAPADIDFQSALSNAEQVIHLSDYYDETSQLANWHVNRAHFLEAWSDGYSYTGVRSVVQPQVRPLYNGISDIELLSVILAGQQQNAFDLVQETWRSFYPGNFKKQWEQSLHDGLASEEKFPEASVSISGSFNASAGEFTAKKESSEGIELVIRPDDTIFDGRFANNGWLQELPKPMTKITWDNVALMSKKTADALGVEAAGLGKAEVELIAITIDGTTVKIPAWVQPGHADDSITISVGYGHQKMGRVANEAGVNTYPLRTTEHMLYATDVSIENTGELYEIACTQDHHSMEGRSILRHATLQEYRENPDFSTYFEAYGADMPGEAYAKEQGSDSPLSIFDAINEAEYPDYEPQWGMAIDLSTCVGCGTCTLACQAENNIPVIGKREVRRGREMHWIRVDRYYDGDINDPVALHQPVPCMHCELAPCEQVCPVAATTHSDDGINQMTYNRCIGTRYCENNCPYKVRRFNFFNYTEEFLTDGSDPEIIQMAMNPNVTVRFRGVMEKCTYCVQRVNRAKINRDIETNGESMKPVDGSVKTACQQACPADAIYFGDLTDPDSEITQVKQNNRNYLMLEELNTRPRTSYLSELRNPNPKLA